MRISSNTDPERMHQKFGVVVGFGDPEQVAAHKEQHPTIYFPYLTANQNAFVRAYICNGGKALDAFKVAYESSKMSKNENISASRVMASPMVRLAFMEIERSAVSQLGITLADHLRELADLREEARKNRQFAAAISAEVARGKASGLYTQRLEVTGKDGKPLTIPAATIAEYRSAREKILEDC